MIVCVSSVGAVTLEQPEDFKRFKVRIESPPLDIERLQKDLSPGLRLQDAETAWVAADLVLDLSGLRQDQAWLSEFESMLTYSKKMGWFQEDGREIRGHVEWIGKP